MELFAQEFVSVPDEFDHTEEYMILCQFIMCACVQTSLFNISMANVKLDLGYHIKL